ncbi:MAG: tetratricopeptide repeat protein [Candidatus Brocadiales bacterium]|nr:tetratricopeptide repeat protein [Candidatus Brocadiales bacterium]
MQQIINRFYTKIFKGLKDNLLFITGFIPFLPGSPRIKLFTMLVNATVIIAIILHLDCNISSVSSAPEIPELKKHVNSRGNNLEGSEKLEIPAVSSSTENPSIDKTVYHFNLGVYYQKLGNIANAIKEYEAVLMLDPDNAEAHNNLGVIYREQNELDRAAEHYQLVVSLNPGMEEAHNNLGVIYYLKGNFREAGAEYRKALELNPGNLKSLINIGLVYKSQGLTKKAIEVMEDVLTEDTFQTEAHYNLAILYEEMGHQEMATWHYTLFIRNADSDYSELKEVVKTHIKELRISSGSILKG